MKKLMTLMLCVVLLAFLSAPAYGADKPAEGQKAACSASKDAGACPASKDGGCCKDGKCCDKCQCGKDGKCCKDCKCCDKCKCPKGKASDEKKDCDGAKKEGCRKNETKK